MSVEKGVFQQNLSCPLTFWVAEACAPFTRPDTGTDTVAGGLVTVSKPILTEPVPVFWQTATLVALAKTPPTVTLDAACAEADRVRGVIAGARQTRDPALATGEREIAETAAECIGLHESGEPCRRQLEERPGLRDPAV